jgi:sugar lactone lactonase YvrE
MGADGNLYVLESAGRKVHIFDPNTKTYISQFDLGRNVGYFGMGADGNLYVLESAGRKVHIFDPNTKTYISQFDLGRNVGYFALKNIRTGQESLVNISLTLRTKNQYGKDRQFKKKDYHAGNYKLDKTDKYKRDTFSTTVLARNLGL